MIKNYLKIALRNILRQKGYSFINIAGLTMGLACFILIGLWVRDELSFDRFHENKDRIFRILNKVESGEFIPSPTYALADRNSILLTETTARKYFGDDEPLGKVLFLDEYNGGFVVSGIIEDIPANSHIQFDLLAQMELLGEDRLARWQEWMGPCYVLLRPGTSADEFRAKLADVYKKHANPDATYTPALQPLTKVHLHKSGRPAGLQKVLLFSMIAVFILVMACVNFMNLSTARSYSPSPPDWLFSLRSSRSATKRSKPPWRIPWILCATSRPLPLLHQSSFS